MVTKEWWEQGSHAIVTDNTLEVYLGRLCKGLKHEGLFGYVLFDVRSEGENVALLLTLPRELHSAEPKAEVSQQGWGLPGRIMLPCCNTGNSTYLHILLRNFNRDFTIFVSFFD